MPTLLNGNKVRFSKEEVRLFMYGYPCSGLRERSYWFEFDNNGDLVDTDVPEHDDGEGASALSQEASVFFERERP